MQGDETTRSGLRDKCVLCGGDPGGLVWEGIVLSGVLTHHDVERLLDRVIDHRTVIRLFTTKRLNGTKIGRVWTIRASQFIEDWDRFERMGRVAVGRRAALKRRNAMAVDAKTVTARPASAKPVEVLDR